MTGAALLLSAAAMPAGAADLGGDCCADLEERIAELEATTARKGNRKVSLTVSGVVNEAVMWWDDGNESNAYVVNNKNEQTFFNFVGDAAIAAGWSGGYAVTLQTNHALSDEVTQGNDDGEGGGLTLWEANWWIKSDTLGQVTVGVAGSALESRPNVDLSGTGMVAYAGTADVGGNFMLRESSVAGSAGYTQTTWADLLDFYNPDLTNVVRYDTPEFAGFSAAASWGEDDQVEGSVAYAGELAGLQIEGTVGYGVSADESEGSPNKTLNGSASVLHTGTGLNFTVAAGKRDFTNLIVNNAGAVIEPHGSSYYYLKAGWNYKLTPLGNTAFYGEYAQFSDQLNEELESDPSNLLAVDPLADCTAGCSVSGSKATVWGFGVVQYIDSAAMQLYIGYRHREADIELVNAAGARIQSKNLDGFDTVMAGGRIEF